MEANRHLRVANSSKWFENQGPLWWRPLSPAVEGDTTRGLIAKVTELQSGLNGSARQFCYAEVRTLIGKTWDPEK